MSLVSHDSTSKCHNGVNEPKHVTFEKNSRDRVQQGKACNEREKNNTVIGKINRNNYDNIAESRDTKNKDVQGNNVTVKNVLDQHNIHTRVIIRNSSDIPDLDKRKINQEHTNTIKYKNNIDYKIKVNICENTILSEVTEKDVDDSEKLNFLKHVLKKNGTSTYKNLVRKPISIQKKKWQKRNKNEFWMNNSASNALKRIKEKSKRKPKWRIHQRVLISLVMLNIVGLSNAGDTPTFSSALTSRMIASFLGYPSTCSLGSEVRPCTLTLTCWLRGGTRLRGCGGWLFSCCGLPEPSRENFDNSIPSSEWKYKPPTKLRQVPQRNVVPNNVFRRRVDDDVTQMDCGLPSSRILQKRIIGGREARFAEFPWQAHVRISEFQCGGVLVSRRFVATAAHCVSRAHTRDIAVWLGAIDTSATHHPARKLGVTQKILHPLFQFRMTQPDRYDIALLRLSRPITYMSNILPICLPDQDMELRGRSGVIAGWGKTDASNGHTGTNLLRSATVPILSKEQCINWHQSKQISVEIHSEMICAGHSDGHQDACLGDSGGPLIVLDNGRYYLVGITSAGFGCGVDHQPGIYHNVKLTTNWIRSVISPTVTYNDNYLN